MKTHLNVREVAERTSLSKSTLDKWRGQKLGPPFVKLGRRIAYPVVELDAWVASKTHEQTAEYMLPKKVEAA